GLANGLITCLSKRPFELAELLRRIGLRIGHIRNQHAVEAIGASGGKRLALVAGSLVAKRWFGGTEKATDRARESYVSSLSAQEQISGEKNREQACYDRPKPERHRGGRHRGFDVFRSSHL